MSGPHGFDLTASPAVPGPPGGRRSPGLRIEALVGPAPSRMELDHRAWEWVAAAVPLVRSCGSVHMGPEHLLVTLLARPELIPADRLRALGFDPAIMFTHLAHAVEQQPLSP